MAKQEYMGIQIDTSRDGLFDKLGLQRLKESYMREDEDTPQKRFAFVSSTFGSDPEHAQPAVGDGRGVRLQLRGGAVAAPAHRGGG